MGILSEYEPKKVLYYFEEISKIPRGSYNEKQVSDYCVKFAKDRNLEVYQDELFNVIIIKEATEGYEDVEPVIMQGHLDMVCEKVAGSDHDFMKDGLDLYVDGDYLKARDTTLGGDDGIAVAFALAILDDDTIEHPRLEVIFTVSEEVGMDGASFIDLSKIKGKRMLNLDSEEEGVLLAGCAGGNSSIIRLGVAYLDVPSKDGLYTTAGNVFSVTMKGLLGGHSGVEINKNRANANILLGRLFMIFKRRNVKYDIISLGGGNKENVIPLMSNAKLVVYDEEKFFESVSELRETVDAEYRNTDGNICIDVEKIEDAGEIKVLTEDSKIDIVYLINAIPNGIMKMSGNIEGLVETSLNLGIMRIEDGIFEMVYSVRSSIGGSKAYLTDIIGLIADSVGASYELKGSYPAWEYKAESKLRDDMIRIYEEMYGEKPVVEAIHAGLECGILSEKIYNLDCISFGPNILDIHTTSERLSLSSVKRVWEYTLNVLKCK